MNDEKFASFERTYRSNDQLDWAMAVRKDPEGAYQYAQTFFDKAVARLEEANTQAQGIVEAARNEARNIVGQATDRAAEVRGRLRKEVAEFIAGQMFPE